MSDNTKSQETEKSNEWIEWIDKSIADKRIKYYEYEHFHNVQVIGEGGFGSVYRANWKHSEQYFVLKCFYNNDNNAAKEIVHELELQREVDFHENIIRYFGITIDSKPDQTKSYLLVMENADGGSLRRYLRQNSLSWKDKYQLAYQLVCAVLCLHDEGIVHRDLHSGNILIHQNKIKLSDFGLSKKINESESSELFGVIPYVDPKLFMKQGNKRNISNEKSDVYSIGVLLWEISSGCVPFNDRAYNEILAIKILNGLREKPSIGLGSKTTLYYTKLYQECWAGEPDQRPTMADVALQLRQLISEHVEEEPIQDDDDLPIQDDVTDAQRTTNLSLSLTKLIFSESINLELSEISKEMNTNEIKVSEEMNTTNEIKVSKETSKEMKLNEIELSGQANSKITNVIVSDLVSLLIKMINEGKSRDQRHPILNAYLSPHEVTIEEIYEWLNNSLTDSNYTFFLGYLNFSGIGTTLHLNKALSCFHDASLNYRHPTAQYYLGICYEYGSGTAINTSLALKCYEESAIRGQSIVGKFALGNCYEKGIGIRKNLKMAYRWYQQAADGGHAIAQYCIGKFYQLGICVNLDYDTAFRYYSLSVEGDYSCGITMLGYCYLNGIGTSIDKKKAFDYYLKAANMNYNIAQYHVAVCFEDGIGTTKDSEKAIEWYKKSAGKGYNKARIRLDELIEDSPLETTQQIVQQWKLHYGLFLDGYSIKPSKQAIFVDDGVLNISLYKGDPIVYTNINVPDDPTNLLTFNNITVPFNDTLKPSDLCINFPVVEITYKGDPSELFSTYMGDDVKLHDLYGHILAKKFLVGGRLYIKKFNLASSNQITILKFYLLWAYNSAKSNDEIQFNNNPFDLRLLPETSNGEKLKTPKELLNWMNNLYQKNIIEIISYNNLIPISKLRVNTILEGNSGNSEEKQPEIANFKEKFSLEEWIRDERYVNLVRWIKDFHLIQGLVINELCNIESSKKIAINFIEVPKVNISENSYFEIMNPATKLEKILITNNIFSNNNIGSFPFVKIDGHNDKDIIHLIVKFERYEILISKDYIKPSDEFNKAINVAFDSMEPFSSLQVVFNEYGHLFPQKVVLGKSLKNIVTTDIFGNFERINLKLPISESLQSYLSNLDISYLLTQKGDVIDEIDENDLLKWKDKNDELEIIELDEMISLYDILEQEQKRKIDIILNNNNLDNLKIIMTGINSLKDLDDNNTEHYKRIDVKQSLKNENYEVFGSIITKNNSKTVNFIIKFELYDVNGFSAIIKTLKNAEINISECSILWIIVGNPLKLSVFSPKNREFQVDRIKASITLRPDKPVYHIKTPFPLLQGYTIFVHAYYQSTNYEPKNIIKLAEWSYNSISFQIIKSSELIVDLSSSSKDQHDGDNNSLMNIETEINIDLHICVLCSDYKSLNIDYEEVKCSLDLSGYILTKENLNENLFNEINRFDCIQDIIKQPFTHDGIQVDPSKVSNDNPITIQDYYKSKRSQTLNLSKFIEEIQEEDRNL